MVHYEKRSDSRKAVAGPQLLIVRTGTVCSSFLWVLRLILVCLSWLEKNAMVPGVLDEDEKFRCNRYPAKVCLQTELSLGQIILLGNSQSMCLNTTDPGVCCDV